MPSSKSPVGDIFAVVALVGVMGAPVILSRPGGGHKAADKDENTATLETRGACAREKRVEQTQNGTVITLPKNCTLKVTP